MEKIEKILEKYVIYVLLVLMAGIIVLATIDLVRNIVVDIITNGLPGVDQLMGMFGGVLIILIGIELAESMHAYLHDHIIHVELVIEIAMIAIARKIIILDVKHTEPLVLFGIAAILVALAIAFYLEKRGRWVVAKTKKDELPEP